jgi:hypothetical protein
MELPKLIASEGAVTTPPPLGFRSLLHNLPSPWRMLHPTFQILSTTKKYSFSLETCRASKSKFDFIFTIEK